MTSTHMKDELTAYRQPLAEGRKTDSDVQSFLAILGRRWWIILGVGLTVFVYQTLTDLRRPPVYKEQFQLLIQPPQQDITNPLEGAAQVFIGGASNSSGGGDYYATQITILLSNRLLQPVVNKLWEKYPELKAKNFSYEQLRSQIRITQIDKGAIVEISYQDSDPERVKFVLDQLAAAYLEYTLKDQQIRNQQQLLFINQQLPAIGSRVDSLQQQLLTIQQTNNFFDPAVQGGSVNQSLNDIIKQKEEVAIEIQRHKILAERFQQQLGSEESKAIALHNLSQSPQYNQLLARLNEIDMKLAQNNSRFTDDYALTRELKEEKERLLPLLRQQSAGILGESPGNGVTTTPKSLAPNDIRANAVNQLIEVNTRLATLEKQQQMLRTYEVQKREQLDKISGVVAQYLDKQRQLNLATESLNRLLAAKQTLEIEASKRFIPWRLVSDPSLPTAPINRFWNDLFAAMIKALVAGGAAAALLETLDRRYHSVDQLSKDLGESVLGTIPYMPELKRRNWLGKAKKSLNAATFLESFSVLFSSIFFLSQRKNCRSFIVSSATSGDGKSTLSFFTALAAAKLGQKVLLIDGDRYFPQGKTWVNLGRAIGQDFADLPKEETGKENHAEGLAPVTLMENLDYFKTKDNAMNPDQLMSGEGLPLLLAKWQEIYSVIIIDTPPILGLSDARLIANQTDGILLVVRLEKTSRDNVSNALEAISLSNLNLIGVVANGLKRKLGAYDYYNYGYYNRYYQKKIEESL